MTVQDCDLQLYLGGVWTDVPLLASGVTVKRGHDPFGSWPQPTTVNCEIDNDTLNYDPARPASLLYGTAGRNTKARIRPNGTTRVWAEATTWEPEATIDHVSGARKGRSGTSLTAEGLLRRLGKWTDPLRSPMYRTISGRSTSIGHWSLEDGRDALQAGNSLATGRSAVLKGEYTLGDTEAPLGAEQSLLLSATSQLSGIFVNASTTAGWQMSWSFKMPALPPSATYGVVMQWFTSNGYRYTLDVNDISFRLRVIDSEGASLLSSAVGFGGKTPDQWLTIRCKAAQSGGNIQAETAWYAQGDTVEVGTTDIFAGTIGALRSWRQDGDAVVAGTWYSHIFGVTTTADSLVGSTAQQVFNGYQGETAGTRYLRLMTELGLTRYAIGTAADTQGMGPQRSATILNLLKECRETEAGRIDDERFDIALTMTYRRSLYNQTPALELTYPGHVSPPFNGRLTDDGVTNHVSVRNAAGGEVTARLETGPMSVLAPPLGIGEYRSTVEVNLYDETELSDRADWELARGTIERPTYDSVTVDLVANPSLATDAAAVREGDLITIDGAEDELLRLLVVGMVEKITPGTWTLTYLVEPYDIYHVGIWDDASWRWDSATSTLNAGYTSSATTIVITYTDALDAWSTTAEPYDLLVGGERVTVTNMAAAAGSGPYTQTATVTRGVNGVSKAQTAGTTVHVADARRWAL